MCHSIWPLVHRVPSVRRRSPGRSGGCDEVMQVGPHPFQLAVDALPVRGLVAGDHEPSVAR